MRAVQEQGVRGFGYRENRQVVFHHPIRQKLLHKMGELLITEAVLPIQDMFHTDLLDDAGKAGKEVRHSRGPGLIGVSVQKLRAEYRAVGHHGDVDDDPLLPAHRFIKLGDQAVHGGVRLLPIYMPHGEGDRGGGGKAGFALASSQTGGTQQHEHPYQ